MSEKADAHIHLFEKGFAGSFTGRPGVTIHEAKLYASLAKDHGVKQALVVAYEGEDWAKGNNAYVTKMADEHDWVRPVAFVDPASGPLPEALEQFRRQRFVGLSMYIFGDEAVHALHRVRDETWSWLEEHRWLISVNSRGKDLAAWRPILEKHGALRIVVSHLGLPPRVAEPPTKNEARIGLGEVVALADFPETRIKLSGFYALSDPGFDYPHRAAWPYVEALIDAFSTRRLVWGSDFTPSLDNLTFPQTFSMFEQMPFLNGEDRKQIRGANLMALLDDVR